MVVGTSNPCHRSGRPAHYLKSVRKGFVGDGRGGNAFRDNVFIPPSKTIQRLDENNILLGRKIAFS